MRITAARISRGRLNSMLRGVFQRGAMAILLMGALLTPREICLQQTHKEAHSCCAQASQGIKTVQKNCCSVSAPLPAAVFASAFPGLAPFAVMQEFVSSNDLYSSSELLASAVVPPQSPPTGAFNLRI